MSPIKLADLANIERQQELSDLWNRVTRFISVNHLRGKLEVLPESKLMELDTIISSAIPESEKIARCREILASQVRAEEQKPVV